MPQPIGNPKPPLPDPDRRRAQELVTRLVAIPGQWGQESKVAAQVIDHLRAAGVPQRNILRDRAHKKSPFGGECGNLIVPLAGSPGRTREPRRMLMAHLDTVPLAVGCRPGQRGRRLVSANQSTALGGDNRSGSAAILVALLELLERRLPHPPLTLLWTVQEEVGLCGARFVDQRKLGRPAMAFNFDGGDPGRLTLGATGAYRMAIHVQGLAAHAGLHPEHGVSATAIAALAIADLSRGGWHGLVEHRGVRGTSNVGVIQGGDATNVVTDRLMLRAEARSHDRRLRHRIVQEYRRAFAAAAREVRNHKGQRGSVRFDITHDYESYRLKESEPSVVEARRAAEALGLKVSYRVADGGLDANWTNAHGIPTVSLGCGQHEIHTTKEYLDLDEFHVGCRLALRLACGV